MQENCLVQVKYASRTWQNSWNVWNSNEMNCFRPFFAQKKITTKTTRNDKKTAISHRREKVNIENFTGQCWAITGRILHHFWSDTTHLCLAITALIFDNCYNGINLTFLDLNDSCNQLYLLILEQFQDGRRTHKDWMRERRRLDMKNLEGIRQS